MRKLIILLLMAVTSFGQSANDLLMSQRNAGNTGNIQRNIGASGAITTTATFRSALAIAGTSDNNNFTGANTFGTSLIRPGTAVVGNAIVLGNVNKTTISGDVTWTFSGGHVEGRTTLVYVTASGGNRTVTLPASVYPQNSATQLSSFTVASGATNTVVIYDDGTNYFIANNPPLTNVANGYAVLNGSGYLALAQGGLGIGSGTSGGIPYFSSTSTVASSAALAANAIVLGGGAGASPATTTTGTGVVTAIANGVNTSGGLATYDVTLASNLGTFASPNTAAGSITWTTAVYQVWTSASGAARTYTLPSASTYAGKGMVLYVVAGTNKVNLQPQSGAQLVLNGTLLTANYYIQAATSAAGNFICMVSDGTNWVSLGSSGTWAGSSSP